MPPIMAPLAAPMAAPLPASPAMAPPTAPTAAPRAAADKTALRCLSGWRWRRHARIDAGLLGRPGLTFRLVLRLPLRRLALLRVHERLRQAGAAAQQEDTGHRSRPRPSDRHSHRFPPLSWVLAHGLFTLSASGGGGSGSRPTL